MDVYVTVQEGAASPLSGSATVSGGGVQPASTSLESPIGSTAPPFGFAAFANYLAGSDGQPSTQAGDRPYELTTRIDLNNEFRFGPQGEPNYTSVQDPRDFLVDLPPGLAGSALAAPQCGLAQLASDAACPPDTRVGHIVTEPAGTSSVNSLIYNLVPEHGVAAEFGFRDALNNAHVLYAGLAPTGEGYVLRTTSPEISQVDLADITVNFFGNPADHPGQPASGNTPVAMFTNPSSCTGQPFTTTVHMDSWQSPGTYNPDGSPNFADPNWASQTSTSPPVTGCNQLQFHPTIAAQPETNRADSPTGLEVDLKVPQSTDPNTLGTPPLKKAVVTLPEGMTVNPSSANGLQGCSLSDLGMSSAGVPNAAAPNCPDASKIGTVELQTPALPGALEGSIYVAKQKDNPFNSLLALYIVVDDPTTGVIVKLPGEVKADPNTGQLTTVVDNSPQFPFSELRTRFFGGSRAALRTPATCGTYTVTSELTPWSAPDSGPPATPSDSFTIDSGPNGTPCANTEAGQPHNPSFSAGTINPIAGAFSPFVMHLAREDGSQNLKGLSLTLPPGMEGKLAGVPYCPQASLAAAANNTGAAEQANPSCPSASQVGTVTVGAGAGSSPYFVGGKAYLAGPYKGAPLSVAIVTPALAGPFDLGTVVVRAALRVDPATAQITAVSDPIPTILQGIPLDLRSIALNMDRDQFTLNPTNCDPMAVTGTALSVLDQSASLSERFQVGACNALGFKPKLGLKLKGGTTRNGHPALTSVLTQPGGQANIARAAVTLPGTMQLDQSHIQAPCTRPQFAAAQCPASSVIGTATATTPLLDSPLSGPVYLETNGHPLPDLMVALRGPASQPIEVNLDGVVDTVHARLRTTFATVPDAPVSKFVLSLQGGGKGLIVNNADLCAHKEIAAVRLDAQSGKTADQNPKLSVPCGKAKKHTRHHRKS